MACKYFEDCSGSSKLCKLREKWGSETPGQDKWVTSNWRYDYCESKWKYEECPDYKKRG